MAITTNDATVNPIKIAGTTATAVAITTRLVYVQKVIWYGATTAAHKMSITNTAGDQLFKLTADAPGTSGEMMYTIDFMIHPHPCQGLKVNDLDSGEVYIYTVPRGGN